MSSVFKYNEKNTASKVIGIKPIQMNHNEKQEEDVKQLERTEDQLKLALNHLEEAKIQASQLLAEAKQQVKLEKEKWETERQEYIEDAQLSGYQAGFEAGKQESLEQHNDLIDQARSIVDLAKKDYQSTIEQSEDVILKLGLEVASKIMHVVIEESDDFIHIVKDVLKEIKEQPSIQIFSHPQDYQIILNHKEELLNIVSTKADLSIYPDYDLEKGSCIVETPFGKIDASVESQLHELRDKLFNLTEEVGREH